MNYDFGATGELANSYSRDSAFEQLLGLAASYAARQKPATQSAGPPAVSKRPRTEDIERRAYQIYVGRGGSDGHDLDDWLQAERQVAEEIKKKR